MTIREKKSRGRKGEKEKGKRENETWAESEPGDGSD